MFLNGWSVPSTFLNQVYLLHSMLVVSIGFIMNMLVIMQMRKLSRRNAEQYYNGIGICLLFLSVVDLISLSSLFVEELISFNFQAGLNPVLQSVICKVISFVSEASYTQSMFCLAIMSTIRFLSITRPLEYKMHWWRIPFILIIVSFVLGLFLNSWLLFDVSLQDGRQCMQSFTAVSRVHNLVGILLSFVVPIILVIYFDLSVICCRVQPPFDPMLQIVINNRPNGERRKSLNRFLIITLTTICLNIPALFLRFSSALNFPFIQIDEVPPAILVLAKAAYLTQFAFKSFYFTTFVYDRSVLPKTNSSRQLSMNFRQRLEDNSHMIRERSTTISYRANSPLPQIQRNFSSSAIDRLMPEKYSF